MQNAPGFDDTVQSNMNTEKKKPQKANLLFLERKIFCFDYPLYSRYKYRMSMKCPSLKLCLSQTSFWVLYWFTVTCSTCRQQLQNHKMVEVGRDLWRLSDPNFLLKQDHLQLVAQDQDHMTFKYLQGWRLHNLLGYPVPVLSSSQY